MPDTIVTLYDYDRVDRRRIARISWIGRLTALTLGALQSWAGRFPVGEDGVSYLDIADSYLRADWHNAVSAYWSPLYSWVLAAALGITRPSPYWESTVVHGVNLLVYIASLTTFEFFMRQLLAVHARRIHEALQTEDLRLPVEALVALGYGLFIWTTTQWITVSLETPDMCLTVFVFLAAGFLLRMRVETPTRRTFMAYGGVLALAYLTKGVMLPLSIVFLGLLFAVIRDRRLARYGLAISAMSFAIIAGPYVAAMSWTKGRVTTGDTGKLAYVWHSNEATSRDFSWHAEFPDDHRPVHPTRKLLDQPAVYEFGSDPVAGAYPIWYDPSYWHEGVRVRFVLAGQLRRLWWSSDVWRRIFIDEGGFFSVGAFVLIAFGFRTRRHLHDDLLSVAELLIPLAVALPLYSIVRLSPRYIAVFVLLFWMGVFASARLPNCKESLRIARVISAAILLVAGLRLIPWTAARLYEISDQRDVTAHMYWQIADGMRAIGARPGDTVVCVGYGAPAYWARLAHVRIVAEVFGEQLRFMSVPGIDNILQQDGSLTPEAISTFARTGAKFIVARRLPVQVAQHGWRELGHRTDWWGYRLPS